jgi:uncharacterized repeat protein (TIGR03803 family)
MFVAALAAVLCAGEAQAGFHVIYTFHGLDGGGPAAAPILDRDGTLYGTTGGGGPVSRGTVYKLTPDGNETLLADFAHPHDGEGPVSQLWRDAYGNFFGTTSDTDLHGHPQAGGTLFEITKDGRFKVLHVFALDDPAGYYSGGGVIGDGGDYLYGTTQMGGAGKRPRGTVFKYMISHDIMTVLHTFREKDGDVGQPNGSLTLDTNGNLYGTAYGGGTWGSGGVFEIAPDGTESLPFVFGAWRGDGLNPSGGVTLDRNGNVYGTTKTGGYWGDGTIFKLAPDGAETLLHSFQNWGDWEGYQPNGGLVFDKAGALYGMTNQGGVGECGVVFKLSPGGNYRLLHTFNDGKRNIHGGCEPYAGFAMDAAGNLYGTTSFWGGNHHQHFDGTIFKIDAE